VESPTQEARDRTRGAAQTLALLERLMVAPGAHPREIGLELSVFEVEGLIRVLEGVRRDLLWVATQLDGLPTSPGPDLMQGHPRTAEA
jgi:hypothetical protein